MTATYRILKTVARIIFTCELYQTIGLRRIKNGIGYWRTDCSGKRRPRRFGNWELGIRGPWLVIRGSLARHSFSEGGWLVELSSAS